MQTCILQGEIYIFMNLALYITLEASPIDQNLVDIFHVRTGLHTLWELTQRAVRCLVRKLEQLFSFLCVCLSVYLAVGSFGDQFR